MQPRISEVLTHLDTNRATLERVLADVPPALREQRPAPERWSAAEVLQHLALTEAGITRLLESHIADARAAGLGAESETGSMTGTFDYARVLDRTRKLTASDAQQPVAALDADAAWAMLEEQRARLRAVVIAADGLALGEVTVPNRVLGPLNAYQWMLFVGGHEARHTAQIGEIAAQFRR